MIQVSVGLCVKNCGKIVKKAIDSIINQDFPHKRMEIIVVDDGSKDETLPVITKSVSKTDIKVKVYSTGGRGLSVARQMAVDNACGKYIVWVDGDMMVSKDFVNKAVEFMEQNPNVGAAKGIPVMPIIQRKSEYKRTHVLEALESIFWSFFGMMSNKAPEYLSTGGCIFRFEAIRQVGGFDHCIKGAAEDMDITIRIKTAGWLLAWANAKCYHKISETWRRLYARECWHGYGSHYISHKHRGFFTLCLITPLAAFLAGLRRSLKVYKLTRQKISFFLPFHFLWTSLAWWIGFLKSHMNGYGHDIGRNE